MGIMVLIVSPSERYVLVLGFDSIIERWGAPLLLNEESYCSVITVPVMPILLSDSVNHTSEVRSELLLHLHESVSMFSDTYSSNGT